MSSERGEQRGVDWVAMAAGIAVMMVTWEIKKRSGLWHLVPVTCFMLTYVGVRWWRDRVRARRAT